MSQRRPLKEAVLVFAAATAVVAALWHAARFVPFLDRNLHALVAVVFLFTPVLVGRRTGEDLVDFGFHVRPAKRNLLFTAGALLVVFPLFLLGFVVFYQVVCASGTPAPLEALSPPGFCGRFLGWEGLTNPLPPRRPWESALAQLVVVALPEELFFRGYLHKRLEEAFPPGRRILGGGVGRALFLSSLLFGLGHVLVDLDPRRLAVFFPGLLFGWMRSATGSILASTLVHAASNLYIDALVRTFFR